MPQNALGGCALLCHGETAILPNRSQLNPDLLSYSIILWLWDSKSPNSPLDLSHKELRFLLGYINANGQFWPLSFSRFPPLYVNLDVEETESEYRQRVRKEKSQISGDQSSSDPSQLNNFFQSLTKGLDPADSSSSSTP